jgi:uncharacterized spore protein YtfJ
VDVVDRKEPMNETALAGVLAKLDAVRDTMTVSRVFGEPYRLDGVTIVPVAAVRGGGGGGGGEGTGPADTEAAGSGAGLGFGVDVRPIGVYVVDDNGVHWCPAVDTLRIVLRAQVVAAVALIALSRLHCHR